MVLKFSRAKLRCCGLSATQSAIRACMVICSGTDSCVKFCEIANHLFCCCPVRAPHCAPKGARACFCLGLSCCHAVETAGGNDFCAVPSAFALALASVGVDEGAACAAVCNVVCTVVCAVAQAKQADKSPTQAMVKPEAVDLNRGLMAMSVMCSADPDPLFEKLGKTRIHVGVWGQLIGEQSRVGRGYFGGDVVLLYPLNRHQTDHQDQ